MSEDAAVSFLRGELQRVQAERDAAQANERQQYAVQAELRQQVGLLLAGLKLASDAAGNEEFLHIEGYTEITDLVDASEARIAQLTARAVT